MSIYRETHVRDTKIGPCVTDDAVAGENILDTTPLALVSSATEERVSYPMVLEIESDGADIYIRQGAAAVALDATARDNARIPNGQFRQVVVQGPGDAYFAHERIDATDSVIRAVCIDAVSS